MKPKTGKVTDDSERDYTTAFVAMPVMTAFFSYPPVLSLTSALFQRTPEWQVILVVAPFWIGLLSAPGYLVACRRLAPPARSAPFWATASIVAGLLAGAFGTVVAIPVLLPVPFAAGSVVCCIMLLRRQREVSRRDLSVQVSASTSPIASDLISGHITRFL